LENELVAITHECDYPESVRGKPVLTWTVLSGASSSAAVDRHILELVHQGSSIYALDAPLLAALHPDLILTQELCEVCAVSYPIVERAARRLGSSPQLVSLEPESLEDVFANIRFIGRLVGRADAAEQVCDSLRQRVASVEQRVAGRPRRSLVCLEWVDPPFNCGHWTPELAGIAGGDERLGVARHPAHAIDWQQLIHADPQVVVVMACGFSLERSLQEGGSARRHLYGLGAGISGVDG